jgi:hypothetical protein
VHLLLWTKYIFRAQTTHIKSIAVFFHPMEQIEVASGKFNMVTTESEFTRLESELSFL